MLNKDNYYATHVDTAECWTRLTIIRRGVVGAHTDRTTVLTELLSQSLIYSLAFVCFYWKKISLDEDEYVWCVYVIAVGVKQRSSVCPPLCPIFVYGFLQGMNASSERFFPSRRGPIHLF